ncbi:NucA/NucB deoxyribonuclease domain-containing protein [Streptosporangium amethystogenes]|uniref:NucA/NucB deoxyribonuclease domain-containing protein n=1 Tax=Streptosporangium amethystogenes TaxID=2002 RepID=UPI0014705129|nr:hypothetical protein [Streptosporangium amethystogenes]
MEYQLKDDPDRRGEGAWSGAVDNVSSGERAGIVVPPSWANDDKQVVWRARVLAGKSVTAWSAWQTLKIDVPFTGDAPGIWTLKATPAMDSQTVVLSKTPELVAYPFADGAVRVEYELEHHPSASGQGTGLIWSTSVEISEWETKALVPEDLLADNWQTRWRARLITGDGALGWSDWRDMTVNAHDLVIGWLDQTPSEQLDGRAVTTTTTPELYAEAFDPAANDSLRIEYEVEHDPLAPPAQGSGSIWSTTVDTQLRDSWGWAAPQVPEGKLADGSLIRWRARAVTSSGTSQWSVWMPVEVNLSRPLCCWRDAWPTGEDADKNTDVLLAAAPRLWANFVDLTMTSTAVEFQIEHAPSAPEGQGSGLIWSTSVAATLDGAYGVAEASVPAGTLADRWLIRWRTRTTGSGEPSAWSSWRAEKISVTAPVVDRFGVTPSTWDDETTVTLSLTPELYVGVYAWTQNGTRSDRIEYQLEHDPKATAQGSGLIWSTVQNIADPISDAVQPVAVPAGLLSDGWQTRWRVRLGDGDWNSPWSPWQDLTIDVNKPKVKDLYFTPQDNDGNAYTSYSTELRANVTDPDHRNSTVEYQLEHDPSAPERQGRGLIWSGAEQDVCSGCGSSAAVPAGTLSRGWSVRWRARATADGVVGKWSAWQAMKTQDLLIDDMSVRSSHVIDGRIVAKNLTPLLDVFISGSDDGEFTVEVEMEHDPSASPAQGTGRIWSASTTVQNTRELADFEVPGGTLGNNWDVRWRSRAVSDTVIGAWSEWQALRTPELKISDLWVSPSVGDTEEVTSSVTPMLGVYVSDESGRTFTIDYEVEHDPSAPQSQGSGSIWTAHDDDVCTACVSSVQVPNGELADGWLVRWRARASTGTVVGAWSDWQSLKVDTAAQSSSFVTPQNVSAAKGPAMVAQAAPANFPYGRPFQFSNCWAEKKANSKKTHPHGWIKNAYNWCSVRTVGKVRYVKIKINTPCDCQVEWKSRGKVEFLFSVIGHTFAGGKLGDSDQEIDAGNGGIDSRTIKIWARIDQINLYQGEYIWDTPTPLWEENIDEINLQIPAIGYPSQEACTLKAGGRSSTIAAWRSNPQEYFEYRSGKDKSFQSVHKLATCSLHPVLSTSWVGPGQNGRYIETKMLDEPVRCDTSEELTTYYGGCVFVSAVPTFNVPMIYEYENGMPVMNESSDLIRRVLEDMEEKNVPSETFPKKTDEPKIIPGTPESGPLHRMTSEKSKNNNRNKSRSYCAIMLVETGEPKPTDRGYDCDEFPFASTYEGSWFENRLNVGVDYIWWKHNEWVGSKLGGFFQTWRVLGSDYNGVFRSSPFQRFYVNIPN